MVHMARDMERYKSITDRICGQIWDSAADITEIPVGVPKAMFPRNATLQKALRNYMLLVTHHKIVFPLLFFDSSYFAFNLQISFKNI